MRGSALLVVLLVALAACVFAPRAHAQSVVDAATLSALAPAADATAVELAWSAMQCAQAHGQGTQATRLTLIDYSKPSLAPRLWVFDLANGKLLFEEVVAHGRNSGANLATSFSNVDGSLQTSLGLFLTGATYVGHNGYSLRLEGLDKGLNDRAMARAIVVHGAPYVDAVAGRAQGRLGRSFGCPAVRASVAQPLIDAIKGGNFVFSYFPGDALALRDVKDCPALRAGGASSVAAAAP
jgi:hypothetical protein